MRRSKIVIICSIVCVFGCSSGFDSTPLGNEIDLRTPKGLVMAVYNAIKQKDCSLYLRLTLSTKRDFLDFAEMTSMHNKRPPTNREIAEIQKKHKQRFDELTKNMENRDFDFSRIAIKHIKTDKAIVKDGFGFAEDLTLIVEADGVDIVITIDDCVLTTRGWLIQDGLKLRD